MRAYLSGPMRGIPQLNFPAFDEAAAFLREWGYTVISPADMDRARDIDNCDAAMEREATREELRELILRDLFEVSYVDMVVLLEGWEKSKGANAEAATAIFLGTPLVRYTKLREAILKMDQWTVDAIKEN